MEPAAQIESTSRAMAIRRLTLTDFRNHARARLEDITSQMVVLTGPNGAGKTNVLEALSLLAPGRGLRRAAFADMARLPRAAQWAIAAQAEGLRGPARIGMQWRAGEGREPASRRIRIDERNARGAGELAAHVRVSWLTPANDGVFVAAAADRRRLIDSLALAMDPEHAARLSAMEKLLRQRNRLLPEWRAQGPWLDAIEAQLAEVSISVAATRLMTVEAINAAMPKLHGAGENLFPPARLAMSGWLEERLGHEPALAVEDACRARLRDTRARDAEAGRTLSGAHRSDVEVVHVPRQMPARLCSTGEQKALLLSLTLAHVLAVREQLGGAAPLLLLDEVVAHLDSARRAGLFAILRQLGAQVWMTGTDAAFFAEIAGHSQHFVVEEGNVQPA